MKNKATPKKLLAMFLSLVLVCTMLQCTLLTVFAEDETIDTLIAAVNADGTVTLDEADEINKISVMYDALADQSAYTDTVTSLKTSLYTLLSEGLTTKTTATTSFSKDSWSIISAGDNAVRIKFTAGTSPAVAVGPNSQGNTTDTGPQLDGLEVMINRLYQHEQANRAGFGLQFFPADKYINSSVEQYKMSDTKPGILFYFDLINGQIIVNSRLTTSGTVNVENMIADEAIMEKLKLANLEYKAISFGMHATENTDYPYQLIIKISGDSTPITVNIPSRHFDVSTMTNNGKVNVAFNRGYYTNSNKSTPTGNVNTTFDFLGYRNSKTQYATISNINAGVAELDVNNVKESDAKAINELFSSYDTLSVTWDKEYVKDTLNTLKTNLLTLMKSGYTTFSSTSDFTTQGTWGIMSYADGAARYTFGSTGAITLRHGPRACMTLDGLELKFHRLHQTATATQAGFGIQLTPGSTNLGAEYAKDLTSSTGLLLYFDLANGKIILNLKKTTDAASSSNVVYKELVTNDMLKLSNLQNKAFTIGFAKTEDTANPYKIILTVADGSTPLTVNIPADCYDESVVTSSGKVRLAFNRGYYTSSIGSPSGTVNTSFDFLGYANLDTTAIKNAETAITALPSEIALTDSQDIYAAEKAYNALTALEKNHIDATKLNAAVNSYEQLVLAQLTEGYTKAEDAILSNKLSTINSWWAGFASEVNTGIRVNWENKAHAHRISVGTAVNMDGLSLIFNRLQQTGGSNAAFAILLSRNSSNEYKATMPHFAVILNATNGTLTVSTKGDKNDDYSVISSDVLKYDNISNKMFKVDFNAAGEGEYKVTVTVDGEQVSGYIPAQAFADVASLADNSTNITAMPNPNHCYVAISAWNTGTYQQLDLVGFKTNGIVQNAKIEGAALTISDSIGIDYKVSAGLLNNNTLSAPYIHFVLDGKTLDVAGELEENGAMYSFHFPEISPDMMNDTIYATLYAYDADGDLIQVTSATEYSVKQYCYSMLEKYPDDVELRNLIVDLLRYGAASQTYTGTDTDNLVTNDLTDEQNAFGTAYTAATAGNVELTADTTYSSANKQATWKSVSLYLADVVNLRFKLTLSDGVDINSLTVKATVDGNEVAVSNERFVQIGTGNSYYLYFDGLNAAQLRKAVAVTVYGGETAVSKTANYSVESYIGTQVTKNEDEALVAMLKALLCYGDSAAAYVN